METIRVTYSRRLSQKLGDDFETVDIGAEYEFETNIPAADFKEEYEKAYKIVSETIDAKFYSGNVSPVGRQTTIPESLGSPAPRQDFPPTPAPIRSAYDDGDNQDKEEYRIFNHETTDDIIERQPVLLPRSRVWAVDKRPTKDGKEYIVVRVGNLEHIPTKNGYARVKSFDPAMISKLEALQQGDTIDVYGNYTSWQGNEGTQWDFNPERIEKK